MTEENAEPTAAHSAESAAASAWPAVSYEQLPWSSQSVAFASNRQLKAAKGPYSAAIPPLIADLSPAISGQLLTDCTDAAAALARFDAQSQPQELPFAAVLLRTESASSSQIENLSSSPKQLALAELGISKSSNANLVVANVRAMQAAVSLSQNIDPQAIIQMHRALLEGSSPEIVGSWRSEQVWIGGTSFSPHNADFVPPAHQRVPGAIEDLLKFANRVDINPVALIALAHAQFETIHPFEDGNGRTGRAIVQAMLRAANLTRNVTVPVSAGLLSNTETYFDALQKYRSGQVEPIIQVFVDAIFLALANATELKQNLEALRAEWLVTVKARRDSAALRLLDLLSKYPVVNVAVVMSELEVGDMTAMAAINKLIEVGILQPTTQNKRNRTWQAPAVLQALDNFGARARRAK
jgi:Fic family protein